MTNRKQAQDASGHVDSVVLVDRPLKIDQALAARVAQRTCAIARAAQRTRRTPLDSLRLVDVTPGMQHQKFEWALDQLRDGHRVRRARWDWRVWISLSDVHFNDFDSPALYISDADDRKLPWTPTHADLLAVDWEPAYGK